MTEQVSEKIKVRCRVRGVCIGHNRAHFDESKVVYVWLGFLPEEETAWFPEERKAYAFNSREDAQSCMNRATKDRPHKFFDFSAVEYVIERTVTHTTKEIVS